MEGNRFDDVMDGGVFLNDSGSEFETFRIEELSKLGERVNYRINCSENCTNDKVRAELT